jgi:acyl-CoA thioester hydrolase
MVLKCCGITNLGKRMTEVNHHRNIPLVHEQFIRVRYQETDAQGRVHHSNYANYFEMGRVEMLRAAGRNYRDLEESGILLVVVSLTCKFYQGAKYDDLLRMVTRIVKAQGVRITHHYQIFSDDQLIVEGETVVAAVGKDGRVVRLPKEFRIAGIKKSSPEAGSQDF